MVTALVVVRKDTAKKVILMSETLVVVMEGKVMHKTMITIAKVESQMSP